MATQTTKNVNEEIHKRMKATQADIDAAVKQTADTLKKSKKVKVQVPKFLEKRVGKVLPVGINGAMIFIPVGEEVSVPERYKAIIDESINNLSL